MKRRKTEKSDRLQRNSIEKNKNSKKYIKVWMKREKMLTKVKG